MAKEMTFLLGFYVSNVVKRWWDQAMSLPWPDTLVAINHALVDFKHEEGMKFCQTIMRYSMLSYILCGKYQGGSYLFLIAHTMFLYSPETQQGPETNVPGQRLSDQGQGGHKKGVTVDRETGGAGQGLVDTNLMVHDHDQEVNT